MIVLGIIMQAFQAEPADFSLESLVKTRRQAIALIEPREALIVVGFVHFRSRPFFQDSFPSVWAVG